MEKKILYALFASEKKNTFCIFFCSMALRRRVLALQRRHAPNKNPRGSAYDILSSDVKISNFRQWFCEFWFFFDFLEFFSSVPLRPGDHFQKIKFSKFLVFLGLSVAVSAPHHLNSFLSNFRDKVLSKTPRKKFLTGAYEKTNPKLTNSAKKFFVQSHCCCRDVCHVLTRDRVLATHSAKFRTKTAFYFFRKETSKSIEISPF